MKGVFRRLLELDTLRGPHSTGVLFVSTTGATEVVKKTGTPWDLYQHKAAEEAFKNNHNVLMGHNRWATQGRINNINAHPFDMGNIIGAHNGTLIGRYNLDDYKEFDVDSENIYHHMERNGVAETIPNLNGAFALTWWNQEEGTLNMIRNDQRTLFYVFTEDQKTLLWASEAWMLQVATHAAGVKIGKIEDLAQEVHHSFEVPMGFNTQAKPFEKVRLRKMQMYVPPVYPRYNSSWPDRTERAALVVERKAILSVVKNKDVDVVKKSITSNASFIEHQKFVNGTHKFYVWGAGTSNTGQRYIQCYSVEDDRIAIRCFCQEDNYLWKKMLKSSKHFEGLIKAFSSSDGSYLTTDLRTIKEVEVEDYTDVPEVYFPGYEGTTLTKVEYAKAVDGGCAWCSGHVDEEDSLTIHWVSCTELVCGDCKELSDVKEYITQK